MNRLSGNLRSSLLQFLMMMRLFPTAKGRREKRKREKEATELLPNYRQRDAG